MHRTTCRTVIVLLLLLLCLARAGAVQASAVMSFKEHFRVSELGDAELTISMTLSAKQFAQWKKKYGLNPSLLRRDMAKLLSQYQTSDFQVEQRDMDRQIIITLQARGVVRYMGDGRFEMEVPGEWQGGQRYGSNYEFHYPEAMDDGEIAQHTVKVDLPARAYDFSEQLSDQGEKLVRYSLDIDGSFRPWLAGAGAMAVLAMLLMGLAFLPVRRR